MAAIYLIRHGQASFGKADYDQLSELGASQSRLLGEHWRNFDVPCKFYTGDLLRHAQTSNLFLSGFNRGHFPVVTHSGFNEFDHLEVLKCYSHHWDDSKKLLKLTDANKKPSQYFKQEFSNAMSRWTSGDYDQEYSETFVQFKERCIRGLKEVISHSLQSGVSANNGVDSNFTKDKSIVVFTSGGPISVICQHILGVTDEQALKINQQLKNTSITKLLYSDTRLSLDYLNNYSHLERAGSDWFSNI